MNALFCLSLFVFILTESTLIPNGEVPNGVCFVATKLNQAAEPVQTPPLISKDTANDAFNEFTDPMLQNAVRLGVIDSIAKYAKNNRKKHQQYREMKKSAEVYYIDYFNNPMAGNDVSHGIWDISFGQIVFKFQNPIEGIPDTIIFNGLLPAVGLTETNIKQWKDEYPKEKPKPERHFEKKTTSEKAQSEESAESESEASEESDEDDEDVGVHVGVQPYYSQVLPLSTLKNHKQGFYVVHNDPDPKTAYAVTIHRNKKKVGTFTQKWTLYEDYCGGKSGYREYGDCKGVINDTSVSQLTTGCKQIILCKNGAFKFNMKQRFTMSYDLYASIAKVSLHNYKYDVEYKDSIHIIKGDTSTPSGCPEGSIHFAFECLAHFWDEEKDIFKEFEFKKCVWFQQKDGTEVEYRVIPPEKNVKPSKEEEGELKDPYPCDEDIHITSNRKYNGRIRFQIKKEYLLYTCCIKNLPKSGTGPSIDYYWHISPEQELERQHKTTVHVSQSTDNDLNPRTRNAVPASAVVGKKPVDKDFGTEHIRKSVIGYRMDHGMSKKEAMEKPFTQKEYEEIMKNEALVKNPANPNKHLISNTKPLSIIQSLTITIALFIIGISSCYLAATNY